MRRNNLILLIVLIVLALVALALKRCNPQVTNAKADTNANGTAKNLRGLNRNPSHINYSKHALCRMDCRHVSQAEVKEILKDGAVNYRKSDLQHEECSRKYAVEGTSKDGQRLRIVFAPCQQEVTVVTCIDLGQEWECPDCK